MLVQGEGSGAAGLWSRARVQGRDGDSLVLQLGTTKLTVPSSQRAVGGGVGGLWSRARVQGRDGDSLVLQLGTTKLTELSIQSAVGDWGGRWPLVPGPGTGQGRGQPRPTARHDEAYSILL